MSKPQQTTPKQMLIQNLILAAVVFLGMQLMCNRPGDQGKADTRTASQLLGNPSNPSEGAPPAPEQKQGAQWDFTKGSLAYADSKLLYNSAVSINKQYQDRIDSEAAKQEKGVTKEQKDQIEAQAQSDRLYGDLLVADTQYKFALTQGPLDPQGQAEGNTALMRQTSFSTLSNWERKLQGSPLWDKEFPVPAAASKPERFPWTQISAHQLYDKVVSDIAARDKTQLVYGMIPGYKLVDAVVNMTGANPGFSYAFAAILLAILVRAIIFPVYHKQIMWSRKMQQLAPLLKEIKEEYTKDGKTTNSVELQQRTMALYQEYGMNPLAGCLPAAIQFPLFITVYQCMLQYQFTFQRGTFLWVNPHASAISHGWFAPNLGLRDPTLIILYGITMIFSTLLMPITDPSQIKQQRLMGLGMGVVFTFMMFTGAFPTPAAFVLYWVCTNLLATGQALYAYRLPMPPLEKVNTKTGGVFPMPPFKDGGGGSVRNGKSNGRPISPVSLPKSTGTPAKHKPKKRK